MRHITCGVATDWNELAESNRVRIIDGPGQCAAHSERHNGQADRPVPAGGSGLKQQQLMASSGGSR